MNNSSRYSTMMVSIVTVLAMIFGLSVAFLDVRPDTHPVIFWVVVAVIGGLFVPYLLVPTLRKPPADEPAREKHPVEER